MDKLEEEANTAIEETEYFGIGTIQKVGDKITVKGVPIYKTGDGKDVVINSPSGHCDCCKRDIDELSDYDVGHPLAIEHTGIKLLKTYQEDFPDEFEGNCISAYWLCTDCLGITGTDEFYKKRDRCFEDKYRHHVLLEISCDGNNDKIGEVISDALEFQKKYLVKDRCYYNTFFHREDFGDNNDDESKFGIRISSDNKENAEEFFEYFSDKWNAIRHEVVPTISS